MLGARIAALRRQNDWSQGELAARLNISPSAVGMYEQGRREPSAQTLAALSRLFGVSMEYLVTGCPTESERRGLERLLESRIRAAGNPPGKHFSPSELAMLLAALLLES